MSSGSAPTSSTARRIQLTGAPPILSIARKTSSAPACGNGHGGVRGSITAPTSISTKTQIYLDGAHWLLHGAIDTHIHAAPNLFPRVCDHIECVRGAASVGMRGVVFKVHHGDTTGRIPIPRDVLGDAIEIYGSITLTSPVGGFNPFAVNTAIKMGALMVWMPTISALNHLEKLGAPHFPGMKQVRGVRLKEEGLAIFAYEARKKIYPEVRTICKLIADAKICLSTGHLSVDEVRTLITLAKKEGVKHIIVQHPEYIVDASIEEQVEFAKMGAHIGASGDFLLHLFGRVPHV